MIIDVYAGYRAAAGTAGATAAALSSFTYLQGYLSIVFLNFLTNFFHILSSFSVLNPIYNWN